MLKKTDMDTVEVVKELDLSKIELGTIKKYWYNIITDALGSPICLPVLVAKGFREGPRLGITAAVHGNELNGVSIIQRLFKEINVETFTGTIIGIPVVNIISLHRKKRRFNDGRDLNRIMPGKANGNVSEVYAYRFFNDIVTHFDYLLDLHTASFGRINAYYIRADMEEETTARMALLQNAQIIVHNPPSDGTLRGAADEQGIPAITLEVGNPNTFQKGMIRSGLTGLYNILHYLGMLKGAIERPKKKTIICERSYWIYTNRGGILSVLPNVAGFVKKGEKIALLQNVWGDQIETFTAPEDGVVIGKSVNPINQTGGRILHLGILKK